MSKLLIVFAVFSLVFVICFAWQQRSQQSFIKNYPFHPAIREKLRRKHPNLGENELDRVFTGLRDYFYCCNLARRRIVSMPSQVVDEAWHEFILFTRSYQKFCNRAFGRYLHHTPAEAMATPTLAQDGIKRAWRLSCHKERINPKAPDRLPLLFALDHDLAIPGGFVYSLACVPGDQHYCASHIGCGSSGCGGDLSCDGNDIADSCGDSGCGGGCGGD